MNYTAFSYSRLNDFDGCPRQFHELAIKKSFKKETTPQMDEGKKVHKALEFRVRDGTALPARLATLEPLCKALVAAKGTKLTELQMAINGDMAPTGWFDKDVYCRAIADLVIDAGQKAALFDYKTGKKSDDFLQLRLTAVHYFMQQPRVEEITCAFIWTSDGTSSKVTIRRSEIAEVWTELTPRINAYQEAFRKNDFPARPSWRCIGCPVITCQHRKEKRK